MEWVHTRGRSVQEALDKALDELGVQESEADLEVLVEPKKGMFGKLGSADAEIRVRVKPLSREKPQNRRRNGDRQSRSRNDSRGETRREARPAAQKREEPAAKTTTERPERQPRRQQNERKNTQEESRQERPARSQAGGSSMSEDAAAVPSTPIPEQAKIATDFVTSVVAAFDIGGTVTSRIEDETIYVDVNGENLGLLVGPKGATLAALEDLVKVILQRRADGDGARIRVDVAGYQEHRRKALSEFARSVAEKVLETGKPTALASMHPADRKLVHDTIADIEGVVTESRGIEPNRRIVVRLSD